MNVYQRKFLPDGTLNPRYKPDTRKRTGDRHKKQQGKTTAPKVKKERAKRHFMAWDGEGADSEQLAPGISRHNYFLLANSEGEYMETPKTKTLDTNDLLDFLCDSGKKHKDMINVIYYGSYDFTQILKGLPEDIARAALKDKYGYYQVGNKKYSIRCIPGKYLFIKRGIIKETPIIIDGEFIKLQRHYTKDTSIQIWDVSSFFSCSFVEALKKWFPEEKAIINKIQSMKEKRDKFKDTPKKDIKEYNDMELEWIVKLMERLREAMERLEIRPSRWDGPPALAVAMLKANKMKPYCRAGDSFYKGVELCARHAYYGGRIEDIQYGTNYGNLFQYDIKCAYAAAAADLPDLTGAAWQRVLGNIQDIQDFALYECEWEMPGCIWGPLPYRLKNGCVIFPERGRGIYWGIEIKAARRMIQYYQSEECALPGYKRLMKEKRIINGWNLKVRRGWEMINGTGRKPFAWIRDLFNIRQEYRKAEDAREYIIKLILVSIYGKLVQIAGSMRREELPPYYNIYYGGYITAATRARLVDAAYKNPADIVFYATDGIYSTKPLDIETDTGETLGGWTLSPDKIDRFTLIQAGFYILEGKEPNGKEFTGHRTRGIDKRYIIGSTQEETREKVQSVLNQIYEEWNSKKAEGKKELKLNTGYFMGMGQAISSGEWINAGNRYTGKHGLKLTPGGTKRADSSEIIHPDGYIYNGYSIDRSKELRITRPVINYNCIQDKVVSYPYCRPWDVDIKGYTKENKISRITSLEENITENDENRDADIAYYKVLM